jgi:hypothetical protein
MKEPYLYFEKELISEYINEYGQRLLGNDYEFMTAFILRGFFKIVTNIDYKIGFRLKDKFVQYYEHNTNLVNLESFKTFIENHKDENIDSDFALLPFDNQNNIQIPIIIQAKRFGHFQKDKSSESLIELLKKVKNRYTNTDTILAIFFDGHRGINIRQAHNYLIEIGFPFKLVLFIQTNKDDNDEWKMYIGEIYPNFGYNEYDPYEIMEKKKNSI